VSCSRFLSGSVKILYIYFPNEINSPIGYWDRVGAWWCTPLVLLNHDYIYSTYSKLLRQLIFFSNKKIISELMMWLLYWVIECLIEKYLFWFHAGIFFTLYCYSVFSNCPKIDSVDWKCCHCPDLLQVHQWLIWWGVCLFLFIFWIIDQIVSGTMFLFVIGYLVYGSSTLPTILW
jgi:hypothetical protein